MQLLRKHHDAEWKLLSLHELRQHQRVFVDRGEDSCVGDILQILGERMGPLWLGSRRQKVAACAVILIFALCIFHREVRFDQPHLHSEAPVVPTTNTTMFASGNSTASVVTSTYTWSRDLISQFARMNTRSEAKRTTVRSLRPQ
jgi:hypothetical protein